MSRLSVFAGAWWEWLCQSIPSEPLRCWCAVPKTDNLEGPLGKPEAYHSDWFSITLKWLRISPSQDTVYESWQSLTTMLLEPLDRLKEIFSCSDSEKGCYQGRQAWSYTALAAPRSSSYGVFNAGRPEQQGQVHPQVQPADLLRSILTPYSSEQKDTKVQRICGEELKSC